MSYFIVVPIALILCLLVLLILRISLLTHTLHARSNPNSSPVPEAPLLSSGYNERVDVWIKEIPKFGNKLNNERNQHDK